MSSDSSYSPQETDSSEEGEDDDLSHLGAAQTKIKSFSVKQESFQKMEQESKKLQLAKTIVGSCQSTARELVQTSGLQDTGEITDHHTRNSTTMIQHNFFQVQQQFGDVTVQGTRNLTIGGTQNIGKPGPSQEDDKPLTWTEKIAKRTASRIEEWAHGMVKTSALHKIMRKLNDGISWITIKGSPGEGKTTVAYMALEELHKSGRQVYKVMTPDEFSEVTMTCSGPVIMLDDIFGTLEFDQVEWRRWKPVLSDILGEKEHRSHEKRRASSKENELTVILVGRDYVLNAASDETGRLSDNFLKDSHVVNMPTAVERNLEEKLAILKAISNSSGTELTPDTIDTICRVRCPHGFPHVCRLFLTLHQEDANISAEQFFKAPLEFLNQTIQKLMHDKPKQFLFKEIIKGNGKADIREIEILDNGSDTMDVAYNLVGTYLRKEDGYFIFDHPSIYDSVAFNLGKRYPLFVIENCNLSFIHERIQLEPQHDTRSPEPSLVVYIPRSYIRDLARRFAVEITNRNLSQVLSHRAFTDATFVQQTMSLITLPTTQLLKLFDIETGFVFLSLIASNKSPTLLKYIESQTDIQLTKGDTDVVLYGVCQYAASEVLTHLLQNPDRLDIDITYGDSQLTLLMTAAATRDAQFVQQIMTLNPDLNARETGLGRTAFHYLCENGLVSAIGQVIDRGVDIDVKDWYGRSPLFYACENNQVEVMRLLLDRGARIDAMTVVEACRWESVDVVRILFERGATVEMALSFDTPLTSASEGGNMKVIRFLIDKGASVNKDNGSGKSPLHAACDNNSYQATKYLMDHGADVNSRDYDGYAPLHTAVYCRSKECVDVLLKGGVMVDPLDQHGQTPLHKAVFYRIISLSLPDIPLCEALISGGAVINKQDIEGNTPLHLVCQVDRNTEIDKDFSRRPASKYTDVYRTLLTLLVDHGADVNIHNNRGEPALRGWCQTLLQLNELGINVKSSLMEMKNKLHL